MRRLLPALAAGLLFGPACASPAASGWLCSRTALCVHPTAQILVERFWSSAASAHFRAWGVDRSTGLERPVSGSGVMTFGARPALDGRLSVGGAPAEHVVIVGGTVYTQAGGQAWARVQKPDALGRNQLDAAQFLGPLKLPPGDSWCIFTTGVAGHFAACVRASDGKPLRLDWVSGDSELVLDFDRWDVRAHISPPP